MKVTAPCFLLALLPALTEAQFGGFPLLPSPPRLLFGGFRPLFPTRSRRPPRRPPPFNFQRPNAFAQGPGGGGGFNQQQNFVGSSPPSFGQGGFPSTRTVNFNPPTQSRRPQQRPQQQQPQQQHINQGDGFGAPKPQSIISRTPEGPPRQQQHEFRPIQQQQLQQQQQQLQQQQQQQQQQDLFLNDPFFHRPVEFINDNSIIGMLPPPPRSGAQQSGSGFQPRPAPPPRPSPSPITPRRPSSPSQKSQVHHVQPSFEQIQFPPQQLPPDFEFTFLPLTRLPQQQRPPTPPTPPRPTLPPHQAHVDSVPLDPFDLQFNPVNSINSNSLDDLVINKVPSVNAGVLPLAHEKPTQLELFPPFNTRRSG